jgi:hypothetical protein
MSWRVAPTALGFAAAVTQLRMMDGEAGAPLCGRRLWRPSVNASDSPFRAGAGASGGAAREHRTQFVSRGRDSIRSLRCLVSTAALGQCHRQAGVGASELTGAALLTAIGAVRSEAA